MNMLLELISEPLGWTIIGGIAAAMVALVVLGVDKLVGRWLSPRVRYALWLLVALRLVLPMGPESSLSAQRLWNLVPWTGEETEAVQQADLLSPQPEATAAPDAAGPSTITSFLTGATPVPPQPRIDWEELIVTVLFLAWAIGVVVVLVRALYASLRFALILRRSPAVLDSTLLGAVQQACYELGVKAPRVKSVAQLAAPALFGFWRPVLCLPTDCNFTPSELLLIALHEGAHLRRRDGLVAWLLLPVQALHWFNPIAWLTLRCLVRYREMACDEQVMRHATAEQRDAYPELLLRFASGKPSLAMGLLGLGFARPAKELSTRITHLQSPHRRRGTVHLVASTVLIALLAVVSLTDASSPNLTPTHPPRSVRPTKTFAWQSEAHQSAVNGHADDAQKRKEAEPVTTEEYDLTAALEKIAEAHPEARDPRAWLLNHVKFIGPFDAQVEEGDQQSNQLQVTASANDHRQISILLSDVTKFGHTWQVNVAVQFIVTRHLAELPGVDWTTAVQFVSHHSSAPQPYDDIQLFPEFEKPANNSQDTISVETVTFDYKPFVVLKLNKQQYERAIDDAEQDTRSNVVNAPRVTLFSGQSAFICDELQTPFVVGVEYIKGSNATAAQPMVAVLSEGTKVCCCSRVIDSKKLDLSCRMFFSKIDGEVKEVLLPGGQSTIQVPSGKQQNLNIHCQVNQGETLLVGGLPSDKTSKALYCLLTTEWVEEAPK